MKHVKGLLLALALAACRSPPAGEESPGARDAARLAHALMDKDFRTVVALTWPAVVERAGGEEAVIAQLKNAQRGVTTNSMEFSRLTQLTPVDGKLLAVFPYRSKVTLDNVTVGSVTIKHKVATFASFYIGLSADRRHWTFIDCEGVTQDYLAAMVPGYQKTLKLDGC